MKRKGTGLLELAEACHRQGHVPDPEGKEWPARCRNGGCDICAALTKLGLGAVRRPGAPGCTCLPAGPGHDHSDDCALEKWRRARLLRK